MLTILSQAGGPLPGAKLSEVIILNNDKNKVIVDLKSFVESDELISPNIGPNDTIYIKQTLPSYLFSNSNLINSLLQVLNIYLTIINQ